MLKRSALLGMILVAIAGAGWMAVAASPPRNIGERWVRTLDREEWTDACALVLLKQRGGCVRDAKELFGGASLRLLKAGEFATGDRITDNKKRFAFDAKRGRQGSSTTYFEIRRLRNTRRVDWVATIIER